MRKEIKFFSRFLDSVRETLTDNENSQILKIDPQRILSWFIIHHFQHNLELFSTARKNIRRQFLDDETILAKETDYIWDPVWSHNLFSNIPHDISSAAIATVSAHKYYLRKTPLKTDTSPLNYNTKFNDRTSKK